MHTILMIVTASAVLLGLTGLALRMASKDPRRQVLGARVAALAGVLLLPALAVRAYGYLMPDPEEQRFERAYGPRQAGALFGQRFVSAGQRSGYFDLVVESTHEAGERWAIDGLLDDCLALGRWMSRHVSRRPEGDVAVTMRTRLVDRYGHISRHEVLTLRWPADDWAEVNWDAITPKMLAELASVSTAFPAVRPALASWCAWNESRWRACR